ERDCMLVMVRGDVPISKAQKLFKQKVTASTCDSVYTPSEPEFNKKRGVHPLPCSPGLEQCPAQKRCSR
ncbi:hypothetical protein, partial [Microcystis aeruginosa]|uniref:hypothetical protein n=1 Tax=Microcystis aeruginosa TaxID=1126 RepID=UPI001C4044A2